MKKVCVCVSGSVRVCGCGCGRRVWVGGCGSVWCTGVWVSGCVGVGVVRGVSVKGVDFHSLHSFFSNV